MNNEIKQVSLDEMFPLMKEQLNSGGTVVFKPKGTSMLPLIRQGIDSVVLTKNTDKLKKYDIPLYRRKDNSFILHRIVRVCKDGSYTMCGDNQTVFETGIYDSDIIGVVIGVYRKDKLVLIKSLRFWLYSRLLVPIKRLWRKSFLRRAIGWGLCKCKLIKQKILSL